MSNNKKTAYQFTTPEQAPLFMCAGVENAGKVPQVDENGFITQFVEVGGSSPTHDPTFTGLTTMENAKVQGDFVFENGASIDFAGATIDFSGSEVRGIGLIEKTYSELATMKTNNQLVAGQWYRITDYVATTTQTNTQSANHPFDIIVLAISTNNFAQQAYAAHHSGDTYFSTSDLSGWELWYSFDNDTAKFAWADSANGKGVIYKMTDEYENTAWYDFKGIQVKNTFSSDRFYYLFDNDGVDSSINATSAFPYVYSNKFGFDYVGDAYVTLSIGCNIIKGNTISGNIIGSEFFNNTIGNKFYSNTIGIAFNNNTIGNEFSSNTIGNNFNSNTIGNNFNDNTIGNGFQTNDLSTQSSQPQNCSFPSGVDTLITTSTTLPRLSKTTYYIGSDNTLKTLD